MPDPTTPALVTALVDDAGLFPPTALAMDDAVARHRADDEAAHPVHTGRFLVPTSRVDELRQAMREGETFAVGLVVDEPLDTLPGLLADLVDDPRLRVAAIEVRLPDGDLDQAVEAVRAATGGSGTPTYVEIPLAQAEGDETAAALRAVHAAGLAAKVRCGGVVPEAFPTPEQLADLLVLAAGLDAPVKLTAGLHHAVPHAGEGTGFPHHGFLAILVAALRARTGAGRDQVLAVLTSQDGPALADEARAASADAQRAARELFVAYGSCSTATPVEDLAALGLGPGGDAREERFPEQQLDQQR